MKKIFLIIGAAALMCAAACSTKTEAGEAENTETQQVVSESAAAQAQIETLGDEAAYVPGAKIEQLTIMDFSAVWCGPCRQFAPVFDAAAAKYAGKVKFVSVDIDEHQAFATSYGIQAVPTVLFLRPDGTMERYVGLSDIMPAEKFNALIESNL